MRRSANVCFPPFVTRFAFYCIRFRGYGESRFCPLSRHRRTSQRMAGSSPYFQMLHCNNSVRSADSVESGPFAASANIRNWVPKADIVCVWCINIMPPRSAAFFRQFPPCTACWHQDEHCRMGCLQDYDEFVRVIAEIVFARFGDYSHRGNIDQNETVFLGRKIG